MINPSSDLITLFRNSRHVLLTTHIYPDGDALGAVLGLGKSLEKDGKDVDIVLFSKISERFEFSVRGERILDPQEMKESYDLVIILDIGSEERTGFHERIRQLHCPIVNIDHHLTNSGFGDFDLLDHASSSTCQIVYHLISDAGLPMDPQIAELLYLGILTDSRYFQNANVTTETLRAAADLLATGFDASKLIRNLTQTRSIQDLKVLGCGLLNIKTMLDGKIAYTIIPNEKFQELGASFRHAWSAGLFGCMISLGNAIVSVSFVESADHQVFCEFRSKNGFDVSNIAVRFGGGGHASASGCSQTKPLQEFVSEVLHILEKEVMDFKNPTEMG